MYGLQVSEDDQLLVETLHGFAEKELRGAAREAERASATPTGIAAALHRMGVAAPVPEEFGGQGIPALSSALRIAEELAWGDPAIALAALTAGHAALLIAECGSAAQKTHYLPRFAAESPLRASVLLYEGFGRQPSELETRAKANGVKWTVTGEKLAVLHPDDAELSVVIARDLADGALAAFVIEDIDEPAEIENLCRMVVSRCGEVVLQTTRDGVQTLGGHGFIREYPVERWYRSAAALSALDFDPLGASVDFISA